MGKRTFRFVFLALLATGTLVAGASPASASNGFQ